MKDDRGRLRLRFSFEGKRYSIALGVENTKANFKLAQAKADELRVDIVFKRFDAKRLEKYKLITTFAPKQAHTLTLTDIWLKYLDYKRALVKPGTYQYLAVDKDCLHLMILS
ncbi:Arm DNA-binding domain-containing protein [Brasilonema bromeliae]|uniref:Min27-like integrase DNA-binding domain-containing protein n=1 Tax=Brasilonema bromeliae SPC951 TaxID=385972 RepID=A0ABX1PGF3_9CYAN|nr:hypothetical protein [Brasilonema bromeliae SPC951]